MRAFVFLFLLFPLIELAVLIQVGSMIGVLPTLLLIVASAILGSVLLRVAGIATAWRAREKLARGELPEQEVLEGLLIAVGGSETDSGGIGCFDHDGRLHGLGSHRHQHGGRISFCTHAALDCRSEISVGRQVANRCAR